MKSYSFGMEHNFGDLWTNFIFQKWFDVWLEPVEPQDAELFGVGSIAADIPIGFCGDVLGSGFMCADQENIDLCAASVWCVRGVLTRQKIHCREEPLLGDLALLSSLLIRQKVHKEYELGIVPHYMDKNNEQVQEWKNRKGILVIDIQSGVLSVVRSLAKCQQIVSSALHGCIAADALGIPNQWVKLSEKVFGDGFKFRDYYSVFGIHPQPIEEINYVTEWHRPYRKKIQRQLKHMLFKQFKPIRIDVLPR